MSDSRNQDESVANQTGLASSSFAPDKQPAGNKRTKKRRAKQIERAVKSGIRQWVENKAAVALTAQPGILLRGHLSGGNGKGASAAGGDAKAGANLEDDDTAQIKGSEQEGELVLKRLSRRQPFISNANVASSPPMMKPLTFKAGFLRVTGRLFIWIYAIFLWYLGRFRDKLRGRDTLENQAVRLRLIIESIGGTAVKIGQQMAMRVDLLPYVYGVELSKMLDSVPAFKARDAVKAIRRQHKGKKLNEIFKVFDPDPIGSASVACVYQAILNNGDKVAVKVRRPRIGETFLADCKALTLLLKTMEVLTIIQPGLSHNFLYEFRTMLLEELDFHKEARYIELFRQRAKKDLHYVDAPKVYFDLSGPDVLVTEFVSGIWLGELLAAVEQKDEATLAYLRQQNIAPKVVARRLIRANQYGIFENLLFHADPHPSNVLVRPNNELVFIDFGSCGAYTEKERYVWRQLAYYQHQEDVGRMVQCAMAILEPLPPIDLDEFSKRLEGVFWQDLYAFKSKHAMWYERTSARIWISFLSLAREYSIPMNLNTLRMIRSTLLYETVAARLYPRINAYREHRRYNKSAGKRARKRVEKVAHKRLFEGLTRTDYLRVEQLFEMGNRIIYLTQRFLDAPPFRFAMLIGKAVYGVLNSLQAIIFMFATTFIASFAVNTYRFLFKDYRYEHLHLFWTMWEIIQFKPYTYFLLAMVILRMRRMLFRFYDREV